MVRKGFQFPSFQGLLYACWYLPPHTPTRISFQELILIDIWVRVSASQFWSFRFHNAEIPFLILQVSSLMQCLAAQLGLVNIVSNIERRGRLINRNPRVGPPLHFRFWFSDFQTEPEPNRNRSAGSIPRLVSFFYDSDRQIPVIILWLRSIIRLVVEVKCVTQWITLGQVCSWYHYYTLLWWEEEQIRKIY